LIEIWNLHNDLSAPAFKLKNNIPIRAVTISPDGGYFAFASDKPGNSSHTIVDQNVQIWRFDNNKVVLVSNISSVNIKYVENLQFNKTNTKLYYGTDEELYMVRIDDNKVGEPKLLLKHPPHVTYKISPDEHWLVRTGWGGSISQESKVVLFDLFHFDQFQDSDTARTLLEGHEGMVTAVAFTNDSNWLITGSAAPDDSNRKWSLNNQEDLFHRQGDFYYSASFQNFVDHSFLSQNKRWIILTKEDKLFLWDLDNQYPSDKPRTIKTNQDSITFAEISPDNRLLASSGGNNTLVVWNIQENVRQASLSTNASNIRNIVFSPNSRWLASEDQNGKLLIWDLQTINFGIIPLVEYSFLSENGLIDIKFSPDSQWVYASKYSSNIIEIWNLSTKTPQRYSFNLGVNKNNYYEGLVQFSSDSKWLITANFDGITYNVKLASLSLSGIDRAALDLGRFSERPKIFTLPNKIVISSSSLLKAWDLSQLKNVGTEKLADFHNPLFISPDNQWLISNSKAGNSFYYINLNNPAETIYLGTVNRFFGSWN